MRSNLAGIRERKEKELLVPTASSLLLATQTENHKIHLCLRYQVIPSGNHSLKGITPNIDSSHFIIQAREKRSHLRIQSNEIHCLSNEDQALRKPWRNSTTRFPSPQLSRVVANLRNGSSLKKSIEVSLYSQRHEYGVLNWKDAPNLTPNPLRDMVSDSLQRSRLA